MASAHKRRRPSVTTNYPGFAVSSRFVGKRPPLHGSAPVFLAKHGTCVEPSFAVEGPFYGDQIITNLVVGFSTPGAANSLEPIDGVAVNGLIRIQPATETLHPGSTVELVYPEHDPIVDGVVVPHLMPAGRVITAPASMVDVQRFAPRVEIRNRRDGGGQSFVVKDESDNMIVSLTQEATAIFRTLRGGISTPSDVENLFGSSNVFWDYLWSKWKNKERHRLPPSIFRAYMTSLVSMFQAALGPVALDAQRVMQFAYFVDDFATSRELQECGRRLTLMHKVKTGDIYANVVFR